MSVAGPNPDFTIINGLVVYVSPNTTDPKIIEFKDFILSKYEQDIVLNNGIKINVPIEETPVHPVVNPENPKKSGISEPTSIELNEDENFIIKLHCNFCNNPISEMNTKYAIKKKPNYITLFALTKEGDKDVIAFLITITIIPDISKTTSDFTIFIEALCSDQTKKFKGGSALLRLVLALCKKFNRRGSFQIKNSYLEALPGVEQTYYKIGYNETYDISPVNSNTALKKTISQTQSSESPVTDEKSLSSNFVNAELGNKKQEEKLLDSLDSGEITWVIDRSGDTAKGVKSRRRKRRKTIRKRKPRKSRKYGAK